MVTINSIDIRIDGDELVTSATISMPEQQGEAWFRLPKDTGTDLEAAADAFFIVGLILALGSDHQLSMDAPVSKRLLYNSRAIQDILLSWYPKRLARSELDVRARVVDQPALQNRTVTCFTGGVDSFDSLVRSFDDVDALLYMHGFDIPLSRTEILEATQAHLKEVAETTGKRLIVGSTNVRVFLNRAGKWPTTTHGAALSAVGHLLSADYGRILIPSTHTYADSYSWGSHPLLDHWYSSNRLNVVHDGAGSTRVQKTKAIAHDPVAQRHLRVCWQNTGKYNCGECDKCLRTMVALSLSGVLDKFVTFDSEVPLDKVRALTISGHSSRSFAVENRDFAKEQGATEIYEALRDQVSEFDERKKSATTSAPERAGSRRLLPRIIRRLRREMSPIKQRFLRLIRR